MTKKKMTKERHYVRRNTIEFQANNLDQLIEQVNRIHHNFEDALVRLNFPCFMIRELNMSDAMTGRFSIYICSPGLVLEQEVTERYYGIDVDDLDRPSYSIYGRAILPERTTLIHYSAIDNLSLPLYIQTFEKSPENERELRKNGVSIPRTGGFVYKAPSETNGQILIAETISFDHSYGKTLLWPIMNFSVAYYDPKRSDFLSECKKGLDQMYKSIDEARSLLQIE